MELKKVIEISVQTDKPLLLIGEHGTGKSYSIGQYAKEQNKKLHKITLTSEITPDDLIGTYTLKDGTTNYEHRPLLQAVLQGEWIVLEELNASPASVLMLLNGLIETNTEQRFLNANGDTIKPHADFRLFATANPTKYAGTQQLNDALLSRFIVYRVEPDYLPFIELASAGKSKKHRKEIESIVSTILKVREDLGLYISPREVLTYSSVLEVASAETAKQVLLSRFYDLDPEELKELGAYLKITPTEEKLRIITEKELSMLVEQKQSGITKELEQAKSDKEKTARELEKYRHDYIDSVKENDELRDKLRAERNSKQELENKYNVLQEIIREAAKSKGGEV